jgi:hypothetical protein
VGIPPLESFIRRPECMLAVRRRQQYGILFEDASCQCPFGRRRPVREWCPVSPAWTGRARYCRSIAVLYPDCPTRCLSSSSEQQEACVRAAMQRVVPFFSFFPAPPICRREISCAPLPSAQSLNLVLYRPRRHHLVTTPSLPASCLPANRFVRT